MPFFSSDFRIGNWTEFSLVTDISYSFGDPDQNGIRFPLITLCRSPNHFASNSILKNCSDRCDLVALLSPVYSSLPNTSRGWIKRIGWKILVKLVNVGDGIGVLDGKFS